MDTCSAISAHYERVWGIEPLVSPIDAQQLDFLAPAGRILEFRPTEQRKIWTYATCGLASVTDISPIELHVHAPRRDDSLPDLLVHVARYHAVEQPLGIWQTVPLRRPWLNNSACTFGLLAPPLEGGPLQYLQTDHHLVTCLWLVPVTASEAQFRQSAGIDAWRDLISQRQPNFLEPHRPALV